VRETIDLKLDPDVAFQDPVIKDQVNKEMLAADKDTFLSPFKTETPAELKEELLQAIDQLTLEIRLAECLVGMQPEKLKNIRIPDDLCRAHELGFPLDGFSEAFFYPSTLRFVHNTGCRSGAVTPGRTSSPGCIPLRKKIVSEDLQSQQVLRNACRTGGEEDPANLRRIVGAVNPQLPERDLQAGEAGPVIVGAANPQCEDMRGKNPGNGITGAGCNSKRRVK
jgi:hypothetical protein